MQQLTFSYLQSDDLPLIFALCSLPQKDQASKSIIEDIFKRHILPPYIEGINVSEEVDSKSKALIDSNQMEACLSILKIFDKGSEKVSKSLEEVPQSSGGTLRNSSRRLSLTRLRASTQNLASILSPSPSYVSIDPLSLRINREISQFRIRLTGTLAAYNQMKQERITLDDHVKNRIKKFFTDYFQDMKFKGVLELNGKEWVGEMIERLRDNIENSTGFLSEIQRDIQGLVDKKYSALLVEMCSNEDVAKCIRAYEDKAKVLPKFVKVKKRGRKYTRLCLGWEFSKVNALIEEAILKQLRTESPRVELTYGDAIRAAFDGIRFEPPPFRKMAFPNEDLAEIGNQLITIPLGYPKEFCTALTFGNINWGGKSHELNGDAVLVAPLSTCSAHMIGVSHATGPYTDKAFASSHRALDLLFNRIDQGLKRLGTKKGELSSLFLDTFKELNLEIHKEGAPCSIGSVCLFRLDREDSIRFTDPDRPKNAKFLCFISCIGDTCCFVIKPDLTVVNFNPNPVNAGVKIRGGSLGAHWEECHDSARQFSFKKVYISENDLIVVGSPGLSSNLEPKPLKVTPQEAAKRVGVKFESEQSNWNGLQDLHDRFTSYLIKTLLENSRQENDEPLTADLVAHTLMDHCLLETKDQRALLSAGKPVDKSLGGIVDNITIIAFKAEGFPEIVPNLSFI